MKCRSVILCFCLFAVPVITGCVRDGDNVGNPVEVVVAAENPPLNGTGDDEIRWKEGSRIGVFALSRTNERWEFGNNSLFTLTETDGTHGLFRGKLYLGAYIEPDEVHEITYLAYSPYRKYKCAGGVFTATVPAVQYPTADAFDPEADFLTGSVVEATAPLGLMDEDGGFTPPRFHFTRRIVHIGLSINDIPVQSQMIEKIVFTVGDAALAGDVRVDPAGGVFAPDENQSSGSITLVYRNGEILDDGFAARLIAFPAAARGFNLRIETEDYLIETDVDAGGNTLFEAGNLVVIPVSLSSASVAPKPQPLQGAVFREVRSSTGDFSGKYIIVGNDRAMDAQLLDKGNNLYCAPGIDIAEMKNGEGCYVFAEGEPRFVYTVAKLEGIAPVDGYSFEYTVHNEALGYIGTDDSIAGQIVAAQDCDNKYAKWDLRLNEADGTFDITNPKRLIRGYYFLGWDSAKEGFAVISGTPEGELRLFRLSE